MPPSCRRRCAGWPILKLGRLPHAHVYIDDDEVSRMHAVIEVNSADDVVVIDLGSAAGTRVNGELIWKQKLRSGTTIQLGRTSLHITIAAPRAHARAHEPWRPG
jgi:pSer/pThr/pTyr-binding forkhead associated (FHA) protein